MSEQMSDNQLQEISSNKRNNEETESFTIGAEEAAGILGVNRSRLSQLTGKGVFSFERRKIGVHNRLFYRLAELLSHQRTQMYGNTAVTSQTFNIKSFLREQEKSESSAAAESSSLQEDKKVAQRNRVVAQKKIKHPAKIIISAKEIALHEKREAHESKKHEILTLILNNLSEQKNTLTHVNQGARLKQRTFQNEKLLGQNMLFAIQHKLDQIIDRLTAVELQIKNENRCDSSRWKKKKNKSSIR